MLTPQRFVAGDRAQALAGGAALPETGRGAVMLADLGGFTPLTEAFSAALGPQAGAEAITRLLDAVFDRLIGCVARYGGVVPSFVGDALLALFPDDDGQRAVACALDQQAALAAFAAIPRPNQAPGDLTLKVGIAAGPLRRFLAGDPAQQQFEIVAGGTVTRMAAAEQQARPGQVLLDAATAAALGDRVQGQPGAPGGGFIVRAVAPPPGPVPVPAAPPLAWEYVRPLIPPLLYPRLRAGQDESLLAAIRPVVALFLRFGGLDYDHDPTAPAQLDAFVRGVQAALAPHQAAILGVTVGDKGSFLHTAFGALVAHPDEAERALATALALRAPPAGCPGIGPPQIGLTAGRVWAGVYGGAARGTYDVMGPAVNLACRLMERAAPGQVLLTAALAATVQARYRTQPLGAQAFKGVAAPVPVHALAGAVDAPVLALHEPVARLPLLGRAGELAQLEAAAAAARQGRGQIVGITGEAGIGKSRLVAAVAGRLLEQGWVGAGGACAAPAIAAPYRVWQPIWRTLLAIPDGSPAAQIGHLTAWLAAVEPQWVPRLPLLAPLCGLPIPDSALTAALDERQRRESREALLVDCLRAVSRQRAAPVLLVLEDCHWLDPASQSLLAAIGRAGGQAALLLLLTYRPADGASAALPELRDLPGWGEVALADLAPAEVAALLAARLAQLQPAAPPLDATASAALAGRAGGNPFYVESLPAYLLAQGVDLHSPAALAAAELPTDLHSLVLGRVDRLGDSRAVTLLRLASVIGRQFPAAWVAGYDPWPGGAPDLAAPLAALLAADLLAADPDGAADSYLFKHSLIQEVVYHSLAFATRRQLHEQLAAWLERAAGGSPDLDLLAYHYGQSANAGKQREYYRKAGDAATAAYLPAAAAPHYTHLLPLLPAAEQGAVWLALGEALEQTGDWEVAARHYARAYAQAAEAGDDQPAAEALRGLGTTAFYRGDLAAAQRYAEQCRAVCTRQGAPARLAEALSLLGRVAYTQGAYPAARAYHEESLAVRPQGGDQRQLATTLRSLALVARELRDEAAHRRYLHAALAIQQELGDWTNAAFTIHCLGWAAFLAEEYDAADRLYAESLRLARQTGNRYSEYWNLTQLAILRQQQGQIDQAKELQEASLALATALLYRLGMACSLAGLAEIGLEGGDYPAGRTRIGQSLSLAHTIGCVAEIAPRRIVLGHILFRQGDVAAAEQLFRDGLRTAVDYDGEWAGVKGLLGLALLWAGGDVAAVRRAARLQAAITTHVAGRQVIPWFHQGLAEVAHLLATRLDLACGPEGVAAGPALGLAEAVAWALATGA